MNEAANNERSSHEAANNERSSDCPGIKTSPAIESCVINDSSVATARLPYRGSGRDLLCME
jgi:hypothetical protein